LLPCNCRATYCHSCWDRALAASLCANGRAVCPSCRATINADFDARVGRLLFSRAEVSEACSGGSGDWRRRLYRQARPAQIRLLKVYGASVATTRTSRWQVPSDEMRGAPRCVCGNRLLCLSIHDRVLRYISESGPARRDRIERLVRRPPIRCDLCHRHVHPSGCVWTCENGRRTVLHAASYDVCEACFALHTDCCGDSMESAGSAESVLQEPLTNSSVGPVHNRRDARFPL